MGRPSDTRGVGFWLVALLVGAPIATALDYAYTRITGSDVPYLLRYPLVVFSFGIATAVWFAIRLLFAALTGAHTAPPDAPTR